MSLFDLEHLLRQRAAKPRPAKPRPAAPGIVSRATAAPSPVRSVAFDHGEPIALLTTDDLADRASAAIRGSRLAPGHADLVPPGDTMASAASVFGLPEQALAGAWTVEPFDDAAEKVGSPDTVGDAVREADDVTAINDAADQPGNDTLMHAGLTGDEQQRLLSAARSKHQARVAAFRDELAQETERVTAEEAVAPLVPPAAPAPPPFDAMAPAPTAATTPSGHAHDVFDRMGQGMAYATTYALPSVALSREFRDFDAMLDAPVMPARAFAEAPDIADSVLEADLAALEASSAATPTPEPEHPTHGESTE